MPKTVSEAYREFVAAGTLQADPAQTNAVGALQRLADRLRAYHPRSPLRLAGLLNGRLAAPKGLYLFGGVGVGKTMLMDLLFETVSFEPKRRLHFDAFMAEAHAAIEAERQRGLGDPIPGAAKALAAKGSLLCLDEFQVNDVANAMILSRLFIALFERGLVLVTTANTPPTELYRDGLNRQLFLPFIDILLEHVDALELKAARDYRLAKLIGRQLYFAPLDAAAQNELQDAWQLMAGGQPPMHRSLDVGRRRLDLVRTAGGTLWATFAELCEQPLGADDYRAIARTFHTLLLEAVPVMTPDRRNEARRFITLIDALYDARLRLIVSAAAEPEALYPTGDGSEAFHRTASRLEEMRSRDYLEGTRPAVLPAAVAAD